MYYLVSFSELRINMRKKIKLALITLSGLRKKPLLHVDCKTCDKIDFAFFLKGLNGIICLRFKAATFSTLMNDPGNLLKCCFFCFVV